MRSSFSAVNNFLEEYGCRVPFLIAIRTFDSDQRFNVDHIPQLRCNAQLCNLMNTCSKLNFINTLMLRLGCGYMMMKSDSLSGLVIQTTPDFALFVTS
jgi:hypothetical protein